ncbi:hypothetical protein Y032_0001g271 [Ancylostoma ceylanicum]|uniref:Uncharacterized protein n=1 Tax=Ancylostoma ceylanicum TaxID=53326 RepID=A0A016W3C8_9BILA|nr:hypothetical protein Y032_0001g271 [Ancylostoma ceylanicum]
MCASRLQSSNVRADPGRNRQVFRAKTYWKKGRLASLHLRRHLLQGRASHFSLIRFGKHVNHVQLPARPEERLKQLQENRFSCVLHPNTLLNSLENNCTLR